MDSDRGEREGESRIWGGEVDSAKEDVVEKRMKEQGRDGRRERKVCVCVSGVRGRG